MGTIISVILTINILFIGGIDKEKEDKQTRIERREDRQKAKAIANVKKWKSEAGHTVYCSQIAPNK